MSYRGRLINPFVAVIARLDTVATRANTEGGKVPAGYDPVFREPHAVTEADGDRKGTRKESIVRIPCQIEDPELDLQRQQVMGNDPSETITLAFHFCDLERLGLVDDDGIAKIHTNDRLVELRTVCGNKLVQKFRGLFATQVTPGGFGLGLRRNLLFVAFDDREQTTTVAG